MAQAKTTGEFADRSGAGSGKALDGKQRLVLLRRDPGGPGRFAAEAQESAQRAAQGSEQLILRL